MVITKMTQNKIRVEFPKARTLVYVYFGLLVVSILSFIIFLCIAANENGHFTAKSTFVIHLIIAICSYILLESQWQRFSQGFEFRLTGNCLVYKCYADDSLILLGRSSFTISTGKNLTISDEYNIVVLTLCSKAEDNIKLLEFLTKAQL